MEHKTYLFNIYVLLKIICQDRSYLYYRYFFFHRNLSFFFYIAKFSVLNLKYGPKKKQKDLSFPSSSFLTHKVPKCGLVVIFQY